MNSRVFVGSLILLCVAGIEGQNWSTFQKKHVTGTSQVPASANDCYKYIRSEYSSRPVNSMIFATPDTVKNDFVTQEKLQVSKNSRTICEVRNNNGKRSARLCTSSKYYVNIKRNDNNGGEYVPVHFEGFEKNDKCRNL